jgi:Cu2+-exporting ATPase
LVVKHDRSTPRETILDDLAKLSVDELNRLPAAPASQDESSWWPLGLSTAAVTFGLVESALAPWCLALASLPIFQRAYQSVVEKGRLNVDVLDAAATTVLAAQAHLQTAASMVWLVSLGDVIRDVTMRQSERAIDELVGKRQHTAWVLHDGKKVRVPVAQIKEGDQVVIYPGELVPIDGTVISGTATIDQKILTGESMPVEKQPGQPVFAATVVREGKLYVRATKVGKQTAAAHIVKLVRNAPTRDTRAQNYAERFADDLVPFSLVGAGAVYAATANVGAAASLLIVDYGTGIRVSAPTTVLSSMTGAARRGILVKGGRYLELLSQVDTVVFDKTGTLSVGTPDVVDIRAYGGDVTEETVLALAAAAEARLSHPIADAIVQTARRRGIRIPERGASHYRIGLGIDAKVHGRTVLVGCRRWMDLHGVPDDPAAADVARIHEQAATPVYVARDGKLIGLIVYEDPVRPESADVVASLKAAGVRDIVMLTGDHPAVARRVAERLGITRYEADLMPERKLEIVKGLQAEGRVVAVVGDGINDSPALAQADVGIAVKGGTDVARETAGVVLLEGNLLKIADAIALSRQAMGLIDQNWNLVLYPNTAAILLSLLGMIGPVGATLISNGSAIAACLNALRPLMTSQNEQPRLKRLRSLSTQRTLGNGASNGRADAVQIHMGRAARTVEAQLSVSAPMERGAEVAAS